MTTSVSVDLQVVSKKEDVPGVGQISRWVSTTLEESGADSDSQFDIAVRLVDEAESQALNKRYRDQVKPTNVLSFPFDGLAGLPDEAIRALGDLVICVPVLENEAREQGKLALDHWAHLVVHGTLHLLGFDHQDDEQAATMEALETKVLGKLGIADPYRENCGLLPQ